MIDETTTETERIGFCQDCGRPLTQATARIVGQAMFCEPCLQIRLAAAATPGSAQATSTPYEASGTATGWTTTATPPPPPGAPFRSTSPGSMPPGTMPPFGGDNPSPVLAGFLGFIPGVGAMYNGQFGKGIAHIVIFFLLTSMGHVSDFFGFLSFLWCCYQAYEAYHTARARREGRPLPDPFGFNDIAERMGIFTHFQGPTAGPPRPGTAPVPPFSSTASQASGYPSGAAYTQPPPFVPPAAEPGFNTPPAADPAWATPHVMPAYEPVPTGSAAEYAYAPVVTPPPTGFARFPASAVWLIGLGVVFLLLNLGSARWSVAHTVPFLLGALAVWIFTRRMAATGGLLPIAGLEDGEGNLYTNRLAQQLPLPGTLFVASVLLALHNFRLARWDTTWPVLLIALGAFLLVGRLVRGSAPVVNDTLKGGR